MSIIHEALKKVQANLQKQPAPAVEQLPVTQDSATPAPAQTPPTKSKGPSRLPLLFAALLVLCIAAWYVYGPPVPVAGIKNWLTVQLKTILPASLTGNKPAAPLAKIVVPAAGAQADNPSAAKPASVLNIQGVMAQNGSTVALINGKIYEQGDEVAGVKILTIGVDAITVLKDGKEESIQVRH